MIEFKTHENGNSDFVHNLHIDGEFIEHFKFTTDGYRNTIITLKVKDIELSKKILLHTPSDFPESLDIFEFRFKDEDIPFLDEIFFMTLSSRIGNEISSAKRKDTSIEFNLSFTFQFDFIEWNKKYNDTEYRLEFVRCIENIEVNGRKSSLTTYNKSSSSILSINTTFTIAPNKSFESAINNWISELKNIHQKVENNLLSSKQDNSLMVAFDFPEEIKTPCEQYLIYFSQFLRDLGVSAASNISHEAGQVLFSVTPENPEEALDKIKCALDVYLRLPHSPISSDNSTEIEILRLNSNIQHLNSQLSLAKAEMKAKDAIIEAKDATILAYRYTVESQKQLLDGDISVAIKDVTPKPKDIDKEDLIEGLVTLKTYDAKVADINLAEIFRRLKKLFNKE